MESDLQLLLETCCPNVYPVVAHPLPSGAFITWQLIGGRSWRHQDNTPANNRHSMVQVNSWAPSLKAALLLARQVEEALCAATAFTASPIGEPVDASEPDLGRWGLIQDFDITAPR